MTQNKTVLSIIGTIFVLGFNSILPAFANKYYSNSLNSQTDSNLEILEFNNDSKFLLAQGANCQTVERFGNSYNSYLLNQINGKVSGFSHTISRRKRIIVNHVEGISFQSCRINVAANVTLKRKIRADAHGRIKMRGDIVSFNPNNRSICYQNAKITDISLSSTLNIGEKIYQVVANRVMPNGDCLKI